MGIAFTRLNTACVCEYVRGQVQASGALAGCFRGDADCVRPRRGHASEGLGHPGRVHAASPGRQVGGLIFFYRSVLSVCAVVCALVRLAFACVLREATRTCLLRFFFCCFCLQCTRSFACCGCAEAQEVVCLCMCSHVFYFFRALGRGGGCFPAF